MLLFPYENSRQDTRHERDLPLHSLIFLLYFIYVYKKSHVRVKDFSQLYMYVSFSEKESVLRLQSGKPKLFLPDRYVLVSVCIRVRASALVHVRASACVRVRACVLVRMCALVYVRAPVSMNTCTSIYTGIFLLIRQIMYSI